MSFNLLRIWEFAATSFSSLVFGVISDTFTQKKEGKKKDKKLRNMTQTINITMFREKKKKKNRKGKR